MLPLEGAKDQLSVPEQIESRPVQILHRIEQEGRRVREQRHVPRVGLREGADLFRKQVIVRLSHFSASFIELKPVPSARLSGRSFFPDGF